MSTEKGISLTAEDLQKLVATAVAAAVEATRNPALTDKQKKEIQDAQDARVESAASIRQLQAAKRLEQQVCSHMRKNGSTRAVYVENGQFMICQSCQAVIRPGVAPEGVQNYMGYIYSDEIFYRLMQSTQTADFA